MLRLAEKSNKDWRWALDQLDAVPAQPPPGTTVEASLQAVWDAAWALQDVEPNGQQWKRSKHLKDALDALIAALQSSPQQGEKK